MQPTCSALLTPAVRVAVPGAVLQLASALWLMADALVQGRSSRVEDAAPERGLPLPGKPRRHEPVESGRQEICHV